MYVPVSDPMSTRISVHDETGASRDRTAAAFSMCMQTFFFIAYSFIGDRKGTSNPFRP